MGAALSRDRMLYDSVRTSDDRTIRALHGAGASINWTRPSGKTPLILACSSAGRLDVVKTLIELGADVNHYKPDGHVGTAIRNAAKRGLQPTVDLLLSHGANPLLAVNDSYCQNALDGARSGRHTAVVRAIEDKICFFSGWLRYTAETRLPSSWAIKIWAVILPGDANLSTTIPERLKLALYKGRQSSRPFKVVSLGKFHVHQPDLLLADPKLLLSTQLYGPKLNFLSGQEGDKEQLKLLFNACRGNIKSNQPISDRTRSVATPRWEPSSPTIVSEDLTPQEEHETAMPKAASIQSALQAGVIKLSDVSFAGLEGKSTDTLLVTVSRNRSSEAGDGSRELNGSCVICSDMPIKVVLIPCGHLVGCMVCFTEVKMKVTRCPICRAPVERVVKTCTVGG